MLKKLKIVNNVIVKRNVTNVLKIIIFSMMKKKFVMKKTKYQLNIAI